MTPEQLVKLMVDSNERNQEMYENLVHLYGEEAASAMSTMANITILIKVLMRAIGPSAKPVADALAAEMAHYTDGYFRKLGLSAKQAVRDMDMLIGARELYK